ncbi:hypothetical protein M758_UG282400 [Ceratodon purpureus]|nr:hypothetical protein M758_UG282400 [Ceratodon purpureus]
MTISIDSTHVGERWRTWLQPRCWRCDSMYVTPPEFLPSSCKVVQGMDSTI